MISAEIASSGSDHQKATRKYETKHGGILHETGAARLDDILNKGLDDKKFVELDSVVAFQPGFVGLNRFVGRCLNVLIEFAEVAVSEGYSNVSSSRVGIRPL